MSKYFSFLRKKRPSVHDVDDVDSPPKGKRKSGGGRKSSSLSPRSSKSSTSSTRGHDNRHSVHSIDSYDEMKEISSGADPFYSDNDSVLDSASVGDISVETDEKERKFVGGTNGGMVTVFGDSEMFDTVGVKVSHVDVEEDEGHVVDDENDDLIDDFMDEALDDLEKDSGGVNEAEEPTENTLCSYKDEDNAMAADSTEDVCDIVKEETAEIILFVASEVSDLPAVGWAPAEEEVMTGDGEVTDFQTALSSEDNTDVSTVDRIDEADPTREEGIRAGLASITDVEVGLAHEDKDVLLNESNLCHEEKAQNIEESVVVATDESGEGLRERKNEKKELEEEEVVIQYSDVIPEKLINEVALMDSKSRTNAGEMNINEVCLEAEDAPSQGRGDAFVSEGRQSSENGMVVTEASSNALSENGINEVVVTEASSNSLSKETDFAKTVTEESLSITDTWSGLEDGGDSGKGDNFNVDITDSTRANENLLSAYGCTSGFDGKDGKEGVIKDSLLCDLEDHENKTVLVEGYERVEYTSIASNSNSEITEDNGEITEVNGEITEVKTIFEPIESIISQKQTCREDSAESLSSGHTMQDADKRMDDQVTLSNDIFTTAPELSKSLVVTELDSSSDDKALKEGSSTAQPLTGDMLSPSSSVMTSEVDDEEFDSAKEELSNTEDEAACQNKNLVIDVSRSAGITAEPLIDAETHEEDKLSVQNVEKADGIDGFWRSQSEAECDSGSENSKGELGYLQKSPCDSNSLQASPVITNLVACEETVSSLPLVNSTISDPGDLVRSDAEAPSEQRRDSEVNELVETLNLCRRTSRSYSTQSSCEAGVQDSDPGRKRRASISGRRNSTSEICGHNYKRRGSSTDFAALLAGFGKNASEPGKQTVSEENFLLVTVNADYLEAEARLAQRRAARAEARELRLRELEKQQQDQQENNEEEEQYAANSSLSHEGPATRTPSTPRTRSSMPVNSISRRSSEDSIPDDHLPSSARELKETLQELEEKFRKAMVTNAQLDNEKATLTYEVEFLKDKYSDLEEAHIQLTKEHKKKCSENEQLRKLSNKLKEEVKMVRRILQERDELIQEYGLVLIGEENGEESSYDDLDDEERKDETINDLSPRKIGVKKALLSQEASELLAKGAAKGSLDVRLRKYAEDKHMLEDEVRRLKLLLEEELSRQRRENGLDFEKQKETSKSLNECKFRIQKAEAEVSTLQANVIRLESLVARYKTSTEELEKSEEDLKAEKRRLQRELREVKERCDELETSKAYVKRQYEKLLHERGRV